MSIKYSNVDLNQISPKLKILYELCDKAPENGTIELLEANEDNYRYIYIKYFSVEPRYHGYGTQFMKRLCQVADQYQVDFELKVSDPDSKSGHIDLVKFFSKFGFSKVPYSYVMRRIVSCTSKEQSEKFYKHRILYLWGDWGLKRYPNIDVRPIYKKIYGINKKIFKIEEHLSCFCDMSRWYDNSWKDTIKEYDTIFISDGIRGRDVVKFIKKNNPLARIIIFYINTYEFGGRNDPERYKDLGVELYTYDKEQAQKAGIVFKHYFYDPVYAELCSEKENTEIWQDIFFVGKDKGRLDELSKLHKIFYQQSLKDKMIVVADKHKIYSKKQKAMLSDEISYSEVAKNIWHSKAILEISWKRQHGISLRPMEAMFFHKKLITSNLDIVNYDFYCKENIFLLGKDNIKMLPIFLSEKYIELPQEILNRYTRDYWIKSFF